MVWCVATGSVWRNGVRSGKYSRNPGHGSRQRWNGQGTTPTLLYYQRYGFCWFPPDADLDPDPDAHHWKNYEISCTENQCCGSRSGMNIPDHISESSETIFWVKKNIKSLMRIRIRDPESFWPRIRDGKISDLGSKPGFRNKNTVAPGGMVASPRAWTSYLKR